MDKLTQVGARNVRVPTWDWRGQPDLKELARAIRDLSGGTVSLCEVSSGTDDYAIVLSTARLDDAKYWRFIKAGIRADER